MTTDRTSRRRRPIYVESRIRASMDQVWNATQNPDQHQRWDVRFGSIAYLPFSGGPRLCIGVEFAMLEAVLLLAMMVQRYRIMLVEPARPIEPDVKVTLRQRGGIPVRVHAVALIFGEEQLTYRQLNERANQLAHHLRECGVVPDSLVGNTACLLSASTR